ncbi:hypothetical protein [Neisseria animalis]|uniref:Uncharacterized protein n=1 Tax=Neisseria animalis TaxID=492 RepID=A0A5P3MVJ2_NEIAN|nr:hypothetical protein [Neisseria animalis]QEY24781.1 hypothetical protein D0T90_10140 [Neisseria animalis]ROW31818.1 hypothetical protein CGZ60_08025 [Neisseria animalis]VEE07729.1 Uncharacterised protein [Neisseria animalis]
MANRKISTHIRVSDNTAVATAAGFELNPLRPQSANFNVTDKPVSLYVWGLQAGERVTVHRARVASLGVSGWRKEGVCCPAALEPDDNGNVDHAPYVRCGEAAVLTAEHPHFIVDDVGTFFCLYDGDNDVVIEKREDGIVRKQCIYQTC